jgi:hypothetical protein
MMSEHEKQNACDKCKGCKYSHVMCLQCPRMPCRCDDFRIKTPPPAPPPQEK